LYKEITLLSPLKNSSDQTNLIIGSNKPDHPSFSKILRELAHSILKEVENPQLAGREQYWSIEQLHEI